MNTLHVLSYTPFTDSRFASCLSVLATGDSVLLTGDAVYALQPNSAPYTNIAALPHPVFVLHEDVIARGLSVPAGIEPIDYPRFVELSLLHAKVNSWL